MLLLVTLALVVASVVLLILGFVQDALGFIYLSMLCAGVAALALFVFARLAKRRGAALAGAGIAGGSSSPYMAAGEEPASARRSPDRGEPVPAAPSAGFDDDLDEDESEGIVVAPAAPLVPAAPFVPAAAGPAASSQDSDPWSDDDRADDWGDEIVFPIEDYDDLRVAEILPLLGQLDPDELQEVRDRELAGKERATILDRIDDRLGRVADPSTQTTASVPVVQPVASGAPAGPGAPVFSGATSDPEPDDAAVGSATAGEEPPAAARPTGRPTKAGAAKKAAKRTPAAAAGSAPAAKRGRPRKDATAAAAEAAPRAPAKRTGGAKKAGPAQTAAVPAAIPDPAAPAPAARKAASKSAPAEKTVAAKKAAPAKKATGRKAAPAKAPAADPGTVKKATPTRRAAKKAQ